MLAPWIIQHLPLHRVYVEPFGGAASVLIRKPPSDVEIYNDLNDELYNFFKVLRNPYTAKRLIERLQATPYSRREFDQSYLPTSFSLERARRLAIRALMGFSATGAHNKSKTGFKSQLHKGASPAADWQRYPDSLAKLSGRLKNVILENRNAEDLIEAYDNPDTLFYVDPPYMWETRGKDSKYQGYKFEMDQEAHISLLTQLKNLKGMVVLSAYENTLYDHHLKGWKKVTKSAKTMGNKAKIEVLWIKLD